jgi:TPP-dependent pyruvate/acetoin dehydrogenase alpha subunit
LPAKRSQSKESMLDFYRKMELCRLFDLKVEQLVASKDLTGDFHLSIGQEAVAVGVMSALGGDDAIVSNFRGHAHAIARGVPTDLLMAELFGKSDGTCKGIGGSMHCSKYPELNLLFATAVVGSGIPIGAGIAFATKLRKTGGAVVVFFGDGAANTGAFHEGLNMASVWKLPLVLVCENNQFAMSMPTGSATSGPSIAGKAEGYGVTGMQVDGNDVVSVYEAARLLVEAARKGKGPALLECVTRRLRGHSIRDEAPPVPSGQEDPIARIEREIEDLDLATREELEQVRKDSAAAIDSSVGFAKAGVPLRFEDLPGLV